MPRLENQRGAFDFLFEHYESQEPFAKQDLQAVTTWGRSAFDTYWSKQLRAFVKDAGPGLFRVSESFRAFSKWRAFRQHVTQVRALAATDYSHSEYDHVLIFEFFMPLTNEAELRSTLDALFYKDTILRKLKASDPAELKEQLHGQPNEGQEKYLDRVCDWVSEHFVGYSVSHVTGRFRAEDLCTRAEAAEVDKASRYLIDETTAITRFIFPCDGDEEAERLRWFFNTLFVESIIEVVNGEDEIWMVESGLRNRLHIWRVATPA